MCSYCFGIGLKKMNLPWIVLPLPLPARLRFGAQQPHARLVPERARLGKGIRLGDGPFNGGLGLNGNGFFLRGRVGWDGNGFDHGVLPIVRRSMSALSAVADFHENGAGLPQQETGLVASCRKLNEMDSSPRSTPSSETVLARTRVSRIITWSWIWLVVIARVFLPGRGVLVQRIQCPLSLPSRSQ